MNERFIDCITGYHAHIYYDVASKDAAAELRTAIETRFQEARMGRWHDAPVGPHPRGSYQVAFDPGLFAAIVPWLALNRGGLTILVHPNSGDAVADHTDHALWLGDREPLDLGVLRRQGN